MPGPSWDRCDCLCGCALPAEGPACSFCLIGSHREAPPLVRRLVRLSSRSRPDAI